MNGVPSGRELVKGALKKKAASVILCGGGGLVIVPILLIIVVFFLISAFFSWLSPFKFTLAGDGTEHNAETKAEIIDGYTLMVKNYMDTAQAQFYLAYGDWYGGTYQYEAAGIDFGTFLSEYTSKLTAQIQSMYMPMIEASENPMEIQALYNAMQTAIANAVNNAYAPALAEYNELMAALDDSMRAEETRQSYEVTAVNGKNGISDSAEFDGKPVEGTNFFGNTEIRSELSAEELLAYIALYKSLKTMDTSDDESGEISLNITPQDINGFFKDTEFFSITAEITDCHACTGGNCKRILSGNSESGYDWEYYCDSDHKNLTGEIGDCKSGDELLQKIRELTNADNIGVSEEDCKALIDSYIDMFKKELDITEDDFRKFGVDDNGKAQEFYEALIDGTLENADIWEIDTPVTEE